MLLATYNGARYLSEQLDSLLAQRHQNWILCVSDDGSSDATHRILEEYRARLGERMLILDGPRKGFASNFLSLALTEIEADYFAFCDQDDLWHTDKLERALAWLQQQAPTRPALYCSRTQLVDPRGNPIGMSPSFKRAPSFQNALVQSIAGGNTMVFNRALKALIAEAGALSIISHDWWLYMLTTGCRGTVHYDSCPAIDYRQHRSNIVGANGSLKARLKRLGNVISGGFQHWNDTNLSALEHCKHLLCDDSRQTLERFTRARKSSIISRVAGILRSGVYRQGRLEDIALLVATILRKV